MSGSGSKRTILLIEDTPSLARAYEAYLKDQPFEISTAETGADGLAALEKRIPDVMLLDLVLPDMDGLDILRKVHDEQIPVSVIVITAHGSINTAIEAMRLGTFDFLIKPFDKDRLLVTVRNAFERQELERIVEVYRNDIDRSEYCGFIGASLPMQAVYRIVESAAPSKATVFITGESGVGKEVCAAAVHQRSPRAKGPFVPINCGAIPRDLMESEIFGHVKGAFTGAASDRDGAARQANGGTLFLDEICEMDLDLQTKLLRFVQTGTFQKVGGSAQEQEDIRIVCATNRDPQEEVEAGRFREDLFYRLHVIPIPLPPLRERENDVLEIARSVLLGFAKEEGKSFQRFSPEAEAVMAGYDWPGNIRQLQNVIRNVVVLHDAEVVEASMLPAPLDRAAPKGEAARALSVQAPTAPVGDGEIRPLADVEREAIENAIAICGGNVPQAAARLGISASTIYRKRQSWSVG